MCVHRTLFGFSAIPILLIFGLKTADVRKESPETRPASQPNSAELEAFFRVLEIRDAEFRGTIRFNVYETSPEGLDRSIATRPPVARLAAQGIQTFDSVRTRLTLTRIISGRVRGETSALRDGGQSIVQNPASGEGASSVPGEKPDDQPEFSIANQPQAELCGPIPTELGLRHGHNAWPRYIQNYNDADVLGREHVGPTDCLKVVLVPRTRAPAMGAEPGIALVWFDDRHSLLAVKSQVLTPASEWSTEQRGAAEKDGRIFSWNGREYLAFVEARVLESQRVTDISWIPTLGYIQYPCMPRSIVSIVTCDASSFDGRAEESSFSLPITDGALVQDLTLGQVFNYSREFGRIDHYDYSFYKGLLHFAPGRGEPLRPEALEISRRSCGTVALLFISRLVGKPASPTAIDQYISGHHYKQDWMSLAELSDALDHVGVPNTVARLNAGDLCKDGTLACIPVRWSAKKTSLHYVIARRQEQQIELLSPGTRPRMLSEEYLTKFWDGAAILFTTSGAAPVAMEGVRASGMGALCIGVGAMCLGVLWTRRRRMKIC
jgi:hypothetical protein